MNSLPVNELPGSRPVHKVKLKPFGFLPDYASAIGELGGPLTSPDPKYVFHTPYRLFKPGPTIFVVHFEGLVAQFGELTIHVNGFVPESGENAHLAYSVRVDLAELARGGGRVDIDVNCASGVQYAVCGYAFDGTDATARHLRISALELRGELPGSPDASTPTLFRDSSIGTVSRFISTDPPSLSAPVSQPCTRNQLDALAGDRLAGQLGAELHALDSWGQAFLYHALDRYGLLAPGAQGVLLTSRPALGLTIALSERGCDVRVMQAEQLGDSCPPGSLDFLASLGWAGLRGTTAMVTEAVVAQMHALRRGGVAAHSFSYLPLPVPYAERSADEEDLLDRHGVERAALTLMSRRLEVAQLNFGGHKEADRPLSAPASQTGTLRPLGRFGLIVRNRLIGG